VLVGRSWNRSGARHLALFLAAAATVWGALLRLVELNVGERLSLTVHMSGVVLYVLPPAVVLAGAAFIRFSATFPVPLDPAVLPRPHRLRLLRRARLALMRPRALWTTTAVAILIPLVVSLGFAIARLRGVPGIGPAADIPGAPVTPPPLVALALGLGLTWRPWFAGGGPIAGAARSPTTTRQPSPGFPFLSAFT
jgi:hypothetical protein